MEITNNPNNWDCLHWHISIRNHSVPLEVTSARLKNLKWGQPSCDEIVQQIRYHKPFFYQHPQYLKPQLNQGVRHNNDTVQYYKRTQWEREPQYGENWKDISVELLAAQYSYKPKTVIYNIIRRLHCKNINNVILKFHEDTFVRHEFCKTNLQINFTFEHENNTRKYTQTINAPRQSEARSIWHKIKFAWQIHVCKCSPTAQRDYGHRWHDEKINSVV